MTKMALLRRQCIRAKRILIKRWPRFYHESNFEIARKGEYDELPGTPIYWDEPEHGEADCRPAVDELTRVAEETIDWGMAARQMWIRERP